MQTLQPGSIVLIHNEGFIPSMIRKHMRLYGNLHNKGYYVDYNHSEVIVKGVNDGMMYTFSARASGGEMSLAGEYYEKNPNHLILKPITPLSEKENEALWMYAVDITYLNKRKYQYSMFFGWIHALKVYMTFPFLSTRAKNRLINKVFGSDDSKIYCFEVALLSAKLIDRYQGNTNIASIYDIYENPYYKPLIDLS